MFIKSHTFMLNKIIPLHLHNHIHITFWLGNRFELSAQCFSLQLSLPTTFSHSQYVVLNTIKIDKFTKVDKIQILGGRWGQISKDFFKSGEGNACLFVCLLICLFFYLRRGSFLIPWSAIKTNSLLDPAYEFKAS